MFKKVLIANRGEIALRIIRTCKELGIKTVAVYSVADKDSLHVKFADEAVCIGEPRSALSYLNISRIIAAVEVTNADAIHPGYGFLSENAFFAKICEQHNIKFIGPSSDAIKTMGDKISAKINMQKAGVPIVPGSEGLVSSFTETNKLAKQMGFPVIIKATAGGGGKGMRIVYNEQELETSLIHAKREAEASFGNDGVYLEKYIEDPRHIEVQIIGDKYGNNYHMSERECSIQRNNQKLIEEAPSAFVTPELREKICQAAIKGANFIGYQGVGTMEFLVDKHGNFYFMEMNTRIQVEHTVTEQVVGHDIVKLQLMVAAGSKIELKNLYPKLHSIECRINAEDPANNFMPNPGLITGLHIPDGYGIRTDTHIYTGYNVSPYYDSMIAKLIVTAESRKEAIARMDRALSEFIVEGIKTTIPLCLDIIRNPKFKSGNFTTSFLKAYKTS
jgi:acetyl-CoA carboxylase biotin carboxylase subunit